MWNDADFVPLDLVKAPSLMLGSSRGQALPAVDFALAATLAFGASGQFAFVTFKIIIDALQLATQIAFLPLAHGRQIGFQFFAQRGLERLLPGRGLEFRPGDWLRRLASPLTEIEMRRKRFVPIAVGQGNRHAME